MQKGGKGDRQSFAEGGTGGLTLICAWRRRLEAERGRGRGRRLSWTRSWTWAWSCSSGDQLPIFEEAWRQRLIRIAGTSMRARAIARRRTVRQGVSQSGRQLVVGACRRAGVLLLTLCPVPPAWSWGLHLHGRRWLRRRWIGRHELIVSGAWGVGARASCDTVSGRGTRYRKSCTQ